MMMTYTKTLLSFSAALFLLSGCSSARETLGLTRKAPDEFAVVKRAPLALPPDYGLRPPRPGAARPQEQAADRQAELTVFGEQSPSSPPPSSSEEALLQHAGAQGADSSIRQIVDQETVIRRKEEDKPIAERILGLGGFGSDSEKVPATVVDAPKESERLRHNAEAGESLSEGETPNLGD